jgi:hypothetical protein
LGLGRQGLVGPRMVGARLVGTRVVRLSLRVRLLSLPVCVDSGRAAGSSGVHRAGPSGSAIPGSGATGARSPVLVLLPGLQRVLSLRPRVSEGLDDGRPALDCATLGTALDRYEEPPMEHAASPTRRDQALAFDVWKYHASVGGADKDRMVQITTWLLGFSAGILSLHATGKLTAPWAPILLIVLGILVSALAAFVALLYGGYATWRWAIADQIATAEAKIAEAYPWSVLLPTNDPIKHPAGLSELPLWLVKPRAGKLARIFWFFFGVSMTSAVVHTVLLWRVV